METETEGKHVVKYSLPINTGIQHMPHSDRQVSSRA